MKKLYLILILLLAYFSSSSQEILSSAGDEITSQSGSVNWTIGEPITFTMENQDYVVTQGFQQPIAAFPIPTLSEWGLIILFFCFIIIGRLSISKISITSQHKGRQYLN